MLIVSSLSQIRHRHNLDCHTGSSSEKLPTLPLVSDQFTVAADLGWGVFFKKNKSIALFCYCNKEPVFMRCYDLQYTNPLKKTQMKSPAGKVKSNEVGCCEEW